MRISHAYPSWASLKVPKSLHSTVQKPTAPSKHVCAGRGREGYEGGRGQEGQEGRGGRGPPRSAPALPVPTTEFNFDEGLQKFDKQKLKEVLPGWALQACAHRQPGHTWRILSAA